MGKLKEAFEPKAVLALELLKAKTEKQHLPSGDELANLVVEAINGSVASNKLSSKIVADALVESDPIATEVEDALIQRLDAVIIALQEG